LVARSLKNILEIDDEDTFESMALTFVRSKEEFGQSVDVPLVEGGENMRVTLYNKHEYAQLWAQSVLRGEIYMALLNHEYFRFIFRYVQPVATYMSQNTLKITILSFNTNRIAMKINSQSSCRD